MSRPIRGQNCHNEPTRGQYCHLWPIRGNSIQNCEWRTQALLTNNEGLNKTWHWRSQSSKLTWRSYFWWTYFSWVCLSRNILLATGVYNYICELNKSIKVCLWKLLSLYNANVTLDTKFASIKEMWFLFIVGVQVTFLLVINFGNKS